MDYYGVKSIFLANKKPLALKEESSSFFIAIERSKPYIEPIFQKIIFESEKPSIMLVSAVGATGKTALAEELSRDTKLPVLDLAKHKPVGDNTLTGILTRAFDVKDISVVFQGLSSGSYGVIIDGIDEGRSKTTEKAFEAFLDDIIRLGQESSTTSFIILGRTEILEECWLYLIDNGIQAGLITILPFTIDAAKKYIDIFTGGNASPFAAPYFSARDEILRKLSRAFAGNTKSQGEEFLSFIGYPPVLDAIVTLLNEERDYHRLLDDLGDYDGGNIEISLLHRIAQYILQREREMKVIPNIIQPLIEDASAELQRYATERAYNLEEQCVRLISYCLSQQLQLSPLGEPTLDEQYEARLEKWLPEHPFITGTTSPTGPQFRNAVFEAFALATLMASQKNEYESLLSEYLISHKHSYHLVYMLDIILTDHRISIGNLGPLFASAMEFRSVHSVVEIFVDGPDWDGEAPEQVMVGDIKIEIEILLGAGEIPAQSFTFWGEITPSCRLSIGSRLAGAFIYVPCQVHLGSINEIELTAPIEIIAKSIILQARHLILRSKKEGQPEIYLQSEQLETSLEKITTNGIPLVFILPDEARVSYPVIQYTERALKPPADTMFHQKYLRLKRILMEFRSHSRGGLARYKEKIEDARVLKNEIGIKVLERLVADKILSLEGIRYHLNPSEFSNKLGISWEDLRKGRVSDSLIKFINAIEI